MLTPYACIDKDSLVIREKPPTRGQPVGTANAYEVAHSRLLAVSLCHGFTDHDADAFGTDGYWSSVLDRNVSRIVDAMYPVE